MPTPKRSPKPRRPGRPRADAADLRGRVLDTAITCFAERGIAATTLRVIATTAGVTPALLHYYFQSKDKLVQTVLQERVAPFVAVSAAPLLKPLPSPRATLRLFLETHMRNLAANPWMPRLMAREVLSEGGSLRATCRLSSVRCSHQRRSCSSSRRNGKERFARISIRC